MYLLARDPRKPVLAFAAAVAVVMTRPFDLTTAGVVIAVAGGPDYSFRSRSRLTE